MNSKFIYRKSKETTKSIKTALMLAIGHCHHKTLSGLPSFSHFQQALWCCVDISGFTWSRGSPGQMRERGRVLTSRLTSHESLGLLCTASRSLLAFVAQR